MVRVSRSRAIRHRWPVKGRLPRDSGHRRYREARVHNRPRNGSWRSRPHGLGDQSPIHRSSLPRIPRPLRVLRTLLAAAPLLGAAYPGGQAPAPPPDPVESGAWLKIFGIISGARTPLSCRRPKSTRCSLRRSLRRSSRSGPGLTEVQARLLPDEVHLRGRIEVRGSVRGSVRSPRQPEVRPSPSNSSCGCGTPGARRSHRASRNHLRDGATAPGHRRSGVGSVFRGLDGPVSGREPTRSGRDALSAAAGELTGSK